MKHNDELNEAVSERAEYWLDQHGELDDHKIYEQYTYTILDLCEAAGHGIDDEDEIFNYTCCIEPIEMLEELLKSKDLIDLDKFAFEYLLAVYKIQEAA